MVDDVSGNEKRLLLTVTAPVSGTGPLFTCLPHRHIGALLCARLCGALRAMTVRGQSLPLRSTSQVGETDL